MANIAAFSWSNTLQDVSGYNHPTAPLGTLAFEAGRYDRGLACFGGNGASVTFPSGSYYFNLDGGKSYAVWVKAAPGLPGSTRVIYHLGANRLYLANVVGNVSMLVDGTELDSGINICDGTWHHVLYSWDRVTAPGNATRLYIDGVLAASGTRAGVYNDAGVGYIGRSWDGEPANAVLSDFRIWNDPVFPNEVAMFRDLPVTSSELAAFSFDAILDSKIFDGSTYARHLPALTGASIVAGRAASALTSTVATPAASAPFALPPLDRVSITAWIKFAGGSATTLLTLSDAGGTPRITLAVSASGALTGTVRKDDGTVLTETAGQNLPVGAWAPIVLRAWAGAITVMVNGVMGNSSVLPGILPVNTPSYSGISQIALTPGPGIVIDDLWIMRGFISGEGLTRLQARAAPSGAPSGVVRGDGKRLRPWVLTPSGLKPLLTQMPGGPADVDPPSIPTGLAASNIGLAGFLLSWNKALDAGEMDDTTPPSVPTGLAVSSVTTNGFVLTWEGSTDG